MISRTVSKCIYSLLWILVAAACASAGLLSYARLHHMQLLSVQTGSMRPVIRPGDAVLVRSGTNKVRIGDVIAFRSIQNADIIITHRIIAIEPGTGRITTKGDMLNASDPSFGGDRIVGTIVHVAPRAGYMFDLLRRPYGLAAVVYTPAILLVAGEIKRLMRHYDRQRYRLFAYFG